MQAKLHAKGAVSGVGCLRFSQSLLLAVAALLLLPLPASADPWPFSENFRPDKGTHSYCYSSNQYPIQAARAQIYNSMLYMENNTTAARTYHATCNTTGDGQTDVEWRQQAPASGAIGSAVCARKWSNGRCDRFIARINVGLIYNQYADTTRRDRQMRKTSCHELGHTLGLDHYASSSGHQSCMRSGWVGNITDSWTRTWTSHHRWHINQWFG